MMESRKSESNTTIESRPSDPGQKSDASPRRRRGSNITATRDTVYEKPQFENIADLLKAIRYWCWHTDLDRPLTPPEVPEWREEGYEKVCIGLARAMGEFLPGADMYSFERTSYLHIAVVQDRDMSEFLDAVSTRILRSAAIGTVNRLREYLQHRLREFGSSEANWEAAYDRYVCGLTKKDAAALDHAVSELKDKRRPLTAPVIFGDRLEPRKANVLSAAARQEPKILENKRGSGYFLPFWPIGMRIHPVSDHDET
jgi:hypothetical protein